MTLGNNLPSQQPGQRSLRLVSPQQGEKPHPSAASSPPLPSPALRRLQRDLEAARAEALSLHELLEELPAILERKFQQRLSWILAEQRLLEQDNAFLQQHLLALQSGQASLMQPASLAPSPSADKPSADIQDSPITQGLGLRRALRHLRR